MFRRICFHWGLASALVMSAVAAYLFVRDDTSALGRQLPKLVAPVAGEPSFEAAFGSAIDDWAPASDGGYFIARLSGIVERHDSTGTERWRLNLTNDATGRDVEISSIAASPAGDLYLLGLVQETSEDSPRMILAKISERKGNATLHILRSYAGMEPAGLGVAGDGRLYLAAMEVERVNQALGCGGHEKAALKPFQEPFLYEADNSGRLVRPILSVSFDPAKPEAMNVWLDRFWETRIVLDPGDNLYLYRLGEPVLEKIDSVAGKVAGSLTLPQSGFQDSVRVEGLRFVGEGRILYTLQRVGEQGRFLGSEARTLDVASGESIGLSRAGEPIGPGFALYDPRSREFRSVVFADTNTSLGLDVLTPTARGESPGLR